MKKVPQLQAEVEELKHTIVMLRSVHHAEVEGLCIAHQVEIELLHNLHSKELERKDFFCEVEKVRVLAEIQASYTTKLPWLYDD